MFPSFKERCKNSKYFAKLPKTDKKNQKKPASFPFLRLSGGAEAGIFLLMQFHLFRLVFNDCFVRASAGAGTATNAGVRVDDIDVAFRNSAHRAFVNACAASNAAVCDFVSHSVSF